MRAFFIALVLIAAIAGGGYYYWRENPEAFAPKAEPAPAEEEADARRDPPSAKQCAAVDARYMFTNDQRIRLALRPQTSGAPVITLDGGEPGNLLFAFKLDSVADELVFRPDNTQVAGAPAHVRSRTFLLPEQGGARVQVSLFDSGMRYIAHLPRHDKQAPAYVYVPELMAMLPAQFDQAPGVFRFDRCEPAAAVDSGQPSSQQPNP
jgi:hypothetical protein